MRRRRRASRCRICSLRNCCNLVGILTAQLGNARIVVPGPRRVYRKMGRLDPIAQTLHSFRFGTMVAAVERALLLESVTHDLDAAMGT
jgi:hypothetical protein